MEALLQLLRDLRRLLAARVNERVAILRAPLPARVGQVPLTPRAPSPSVAPAVPAMSSPRLQALPSAASVRPPPPVPAHQAGLVAGLFATPQSVAAAFVAAEILGKPVALRDP